MELKNFIKNSLKDLLSAVAETESELNLPTKVFSFSVYRKGQREDAVIDFDIAVTASEGMSTGANGKGVAEIKVMGINVGGNAESKLDYDNIKANVSRIKFSLTIDSDNVIHHLRNKIEGVELKT